MSIAEIISARGSLIHPRFISNIKAGSRLLGIVQEVAMAKIHCDIEFQLKKKPLFKIKIDTISAPIGNPAPMKNAKLQENPRISKKVEYVVDDTDLKASEAIIGLHSGSISVSSITRILSAGLVGIKSQRKLVPTRWAITAVDSLISNNFIKKIKGYSWLNEFLVFNGEFLGNHYEILLLPREWSFEVLETNGGFFMVDYEDFFGRKDYAKEVSGAYYTNRLAVCEYLERIKKQAGALVLREVKQEYWVPCGVGILREVTRNAFVKSGIKFTSLKEALDNIQSRLEIPITEFIKRSNLLKGMEQKKLGSFTQAH